MRLIVRLARGGLIHCDLNEFNLIIDDDEKITLIDFPQVVRVNHPNAEMLFDRDVQCIKDLFIRKYGIEVTEWPKFTDVVPPEMLVEPNQNTSTAELKHPTVAGTGGGQIEVTLVMDDREEEMVTAALGQKRDKDEIADDEDDEDGSDISDGGEEEGSEDGRSDGDSSCEDVKGVTKSNKSDQGGHRLPRNRRSRGERRSDSKRYSVLSLGDDSVSESELGQSPPLPHNRRRKSGEEESEGDLSDGGEEGVSEFGEDTCEAPVDVQSVWKPKVKRTNARHAHTSAVQNEVNARRRQQQKSNKNKHKGKGASKLHKELSSIF
eukprot:GHVN01079963.1.p3 GENE.GHVN01079963.1~~GHVN01079963.1.p3  ORF type:complete len:321 (-),score=93.12 GHVN01079963.1:1832-2794(-)